MIKLSRIDHINMKVKNLAESQAFYKDLFGFEEKQRGTWDGKPWVIIGVPGQAYLCLYEHGNVPMVEEGLRLSHFGFYVENFNEVEAKLKEKGIPINYGGAVAQGKSRSIYINDPSGFEIELAEFLGGALN